MKNPFDARTDPTNYAIFDHFISRLNIDKFKEDFFDKLYKETLKKIDKHIEEKTPGLLQSFLDLYNDVSEKCARNQELVDQIEEKTKSLFKSASLTEDVYRMRDEMKEVKETMDKMKGKLKKLFD